MNRDDLGLWLLLGFGALLVLGAGGVVGVTYWNESQNARKWAPILAAAESANGIPPGLLARQAYQESRYRGDIIDGTTVSPAGALGILQLMPQYFDTVDRPTPFSDADTQDQINQAAQYMARLYRQFGNWGYALAAYNDGPKNINKVLAGNATLPQETQDYVSQILADVPVAGASLPA